MFCSFSQHLPNKPFDQTCLCVWVGPAAPTGTNGGSDWRSHVVLQRPLPGELDFGFSLESNGTFKLRSAEDSLIICFFFSFNGAIATVRHEPYFYSTVWVTINEGRKIDHRFIRDFFFFFLFANSCIKILWFSLNFKYLQTTIRTSSNRLSSSLLVTDWTSDAHGSHGHSVILKVGLRKHSALKSGQQ